MNLMPSDYEMKSKSNSKLSKLLKELNHGKQPMSKNHRNYITKMISKMNTTGGLASVHAGTMHQKPNLRLNEMLMNNNHRQQKITRFTSSKNLPPFPSGKRDDSEQEGYMTKFN